MDLRTLVPFAVWTFLHVWIPLAAGQSRDTARSVVDSVQTKSLKAIRGIVLGENATDGISIAVSKQWLEKEMPDVYAKTIEAAELGANRARVQLRDRLKRLVGLKEGAFRFLVQNELDRVELEIENPPHEDYQFLVLQVKSVAVTNRNLGNEANRKIAMWSWHERLADVETRKPNILVGELKAKNIDATSPPPSLASRFYPTVETDEQWTTRLAIVAHRLEQQIEFQGTGDVMLAVGGNQPADITSLMSQLLQSQMSSLLRELSGGASQPSQHKTDDVSWTKNPISQSEKIEATYFRATQVRMDTLRSVVIVDSLFMVKQPSGIWTIVWRNLSTQNANDQKQELIDRIKEDPQVKAIRSQFENLGLPTTSLESALQMGAATLTAQNHVNNAFLSFSEGYLKRLDSPQVQAMGK